MEGLCKYESIVNGALALEDIAFLNDALDIKAANAELVKQEQERNR